METVIGIIAVVLGVSLLIVIHEAGHFLVARGFGMKVDRFSIGFGPKVLSTRRGDTEFAISALPLGGYVRIVGMAPDEDVDPTDRSLYCNQAAWRRFLAILAGPAMNYLFAVVLAAGLLLGPGLGTPDRSASVGRIQPGSPAEQAGLQRGDRVLSVDARPVATWEDLVGQIQSHPGAEIPLLIERGAGEGAQRLTLRITPRDDGGVGRAGFGTHTARVRSAGGGAIVDAFRRTNEIVWSQVTVFGKLFSGAAKGTKLLGPIGMGEQFLLAWRDGTAAFMDFMWMISVVLAVLNLFPLPALDGGRLVFLAYEVVTRRRVNARVENAVHLVGFLALIVLLVGVTVLGDLGLGKHLPRLGGR